MTGDASLTPKKRRFGLRRPREAKWLYGPLLALDVALLLIALAFANVTAEGPAERTLGRSVAILTEVDTFLDEHYQSLQLEAQQPDTTKITLRDFPLDVTFAPSEVKDTNREQFRALLLQRSAALLHNDGMAAFEQNGTSGVSSGSPEGAIRDVLDLLRPTPHRVFTGMTIALAAAGALLATALAFSTRGFGRATSVGVSLLFASLPYLIVAVALRYMLRVAADGTDDYLTRGFLQLGQELAWAPIRDGIIFSTGSAALLAGGSLLARWSDAKTI